MKFPVRVIIVRTKVFAGWRCAHNRVLASLNYPSVFTCKYNDDYAVANYPVLLPFSLPGARVPPRDRTLHS
jgi:hypothetical protein